MTRQLPVAVQHQDVILERIANGHKLSAIAADYNVSINSISKALRALPEYKDAQIAGVEVRLDAAEEALDASTDMLGLSRAREQLNHQRWRAEVTAPDIYSRKGPAITVVTGSYLDALKAAQEMRLVVEDVQVVEGDPQIQGEDE